MYALFLNNFNLRVDDLLMTLALTSFVPLTFIFFAFSNQLSGHTMTLLSPEMVLTLKS